MAMAYVVGVVLGFITGQELIAMNETKAITATTTMGIMMATGLILLFVR